jgi:hypothetical protein
VTYHFTLIRDGKPAMDVRESYVEPVSALRRPLPEAMIEAPELYRPSMLYLLVFHLVDHIANQIDAARVNG